MLSRAVRAAKVEDPPPIEDGLIDYWISSHGYESRSVKHLEFDQSNVTRSISFGFDVELADANEDVAARVENERRLLLSRGFELLNTDDDGFEIAVRSGLDDFAGSGRRPRVVADISSMNRTRIASLMLACASESFDKGCDLDLIYFPSTFASHKHEYEPLEYFGPLHERVAGWPADPDSPLALVVGLGTEPRRAEGIVETVEPDILSLLEPLGDDPQFVVDVRTENRRLLDVGGEPLPYQLRDAVGTYWALRAIVERLSDRARVIVVPLGPKILVPVAMAVALELGPKVGLWRASAGSSVQPVDVQGADEAVRVRFAFGSGPARVDVRSG